MTNQQNNNQNLNQTQKQTSTKQKPQPRTYKQSPVNNIVSSLVGENKELGKYWKIVKVVEGFESQMSALSDADLQAKTPYFRARLEGLEGETLNKKLEEILPEAFAVVREAAWRTIGKKPFPVQLLGAMVLNDGRIAEMKTGEGKTLVAPIAAYLNALPKNNQVHIVTVNDYLARIGASEMGELFEFLGLTTGVVQPNSSFYFKLGFQADEMDEKKRDIGRVDTMVDGELQDNKSVIDVKHLVPCDKKRAYWNDELNLPVDIVYAVNSELGFDYLRDNMVQTPDEVNMKGGLVMAIVDEVDSILIDEARTPLIISSQDESSSQRYRQFAKIVNQLNPEIDYNVDEKRKTVVLTDEGVTKIESILSIDNLYADEANVVLIHHLDQALKAKGLFTKEKEYVIKDNEIVIVDEFTGRMMFGRRFNQGLHQAIEAKESVEVQAESKTVATITYQNFFRMYAKLSGMTGTASTESEELFKIYKLLVVTIPTNRPMIRKDHIDKIFKNENGKFTAVVRDIVDIHKTGQPILIGTTSIDRNLTLSKMLNEAGIEHQILNAKNHEQEAKIISEAGKKGSVTLATNIAGRGVDIILGGRQPDDESQKPKWLQDHEEVKSLGGLYVIGTERHESRRIDNQLRGRSGRQGDRGESQFYISLQDYILRVFGGDKADNYSKILPIADDEAIQFGGVAFLVESAQKKIEGQNFDIRKHVTEYDDVINKQRSVIYEKRKRVLLNQDFNWEEELDNALYRESDRIIKMLPKFGAKSNPETEKAHKNIENALSNILSSSKYSLEDIKILVSKYKTDTKKMVIEMKDSLLNFLKLEWANYDDVTKSAITRFIYIRSIDVLWTEHLVSIDHLQDSTRLRYIAQKDPLTEFKEEGMVLFQSLLREIDTEITSILFQVKLDMIPAGFINYDKIENA
jgi:preprotein translocase subunit SecA